MPIDARRTRILPGRAEDYARFHATIPEPLAHALRGAGVIRWEIWMDGDHTLFHRVETTDGYAAMVAAMDALPPDPEDHFNEVIATLISSEPADDAMLRPVWLLTTVDQGPQIVD